MKPLHCAANKLQGTFDQCSPAVKNTLFRAYCMPMYACHLWSKYTQASMKRPRAVCNNAYRIVHCIPRNVSVRPHQVSHRVTTFDALLRNNLYRFLQRCASSSNFFIQSLQMSDNFYKSLFFPQLFNAPAWQWPSHRVVNPAQVYLKKTMLVQFARLWKICSHHHHSLRKRFRCTGVCLNNSKTVPKLISH